ncbi:Rho guanine nucleotide exchange factor 37 [Varanus komodoensis]|nr:Rho guanine nucleotide exchange factor 37 [Varanus komodoensis]
MHGQTTTQEIFRQLCDAIADASLLWKSFAGIITDGAPSMTGRRSGVVAFVQRKLEKEAVEEAISLHCIIHQRALCSKCLKFDNVMSDVVKCINHIRSRGLKHRQFRAFLEEIESAYEDVLYYTKVHWLSGGNVLKRFFELRAEVKTFMEKDGMAVPVLRDPKWLMDLAFLVDITRELNVLNKKLQGQGQFVSAAYDNVRAFSTKLVLGKAQLSQTNLCHFPACKAHMDSGTPFSDEKYADAIVKLQEEFDHRFADFKTHRATFQIFDDPFSFDVQGIPRPSQSHASTTMRNKMKQEQGDDGYAQEARAQALDMANDSTEELPVQAEDPEAEEHIYETVEWPDKAEQNQRLAVEELINTEASYVHNLQLCIGDIRRHLQKKQLPQMDLEGLFSNIDDVLCVSKHFLRGLEEAVNHKHDEQLLHISTLFQELKEEMENVYKTYCSNYDQALLLLESYRKDPRLQKEMVDTLTSTVPYTGASDLSFFLVMPVQRVTKYPLLLQKILENTPASNSAYEALRAAANAMIDVNANINEYKRRKEVADKYNKPGYLTLRERLARLNTHSIAKKTTRLSRLFMHEAGIVSKPKLTGRSTAIKYSDDPAADLDGFQRGLEQCLEDREIRCF